MTLWFFHNYLKAMNELFFEKPASENQCWTSFSDN